MEEMFMIDQLDTLKVLSAAPLRVKILWELHDQAKTGTMLAEQFDMPPAKIHYHLRELQRIGIITIEKTEEKNGIVQKFYRIAAKTIYVDPALFEQHSGDQELMNSLRVNILESLQRTQKIALNLDHEALKNPQSWFQCCLDVRLTDEQYKRVRQKFNDFIDELKPYVNQDDGNAYHFQFLGLPMESESNQ